MRTVVEPDTQEHWHMPMWLGVCLLLAIAGSSSGKSIEHTSWVRCRICFCCSARSFTYSCTAGTAVMPAMQFTTAMTRIR